MASALSPLHQPLAVTFPDTKESFLYARDLQHLPTLPTPNDSQQPVSRRRAGCSLHSRRRCITTPGHAQQTRHRTWVSTWLRAHVSNLLWPAAPKTYSLQSYRSPGGVVAPPCTPSAHAHPPCDRTRCDAASGLQYTPTQMCQTPAVERTQRCGRATPRVEQGWATRRSLLLFGGCHAGPAAAG
jgi:hypothetical protein